MSILIHFQYPQTDEYSISIELLNIVVCQYWITMGTMNAESLDWCWSTSRRVL